MKHLGVSGVVALAAVMVGGVSTRAQREPNATPTFNQDVAPILFNNCVTCHSPGQIAPMSLLSYQAARPWARAIKVKVLAREMPPWPADPRFGVFRNGHNLTQAQINTLVTWVDRGAPQGTGAAPEPPPVAEGGWSHPSGRPPDLVVEMPFEMNIPAQGQFPWFDLVQPWPFQEDKLIEAVQVLPGSVAVVHHITARFRKLRPGTKIGSGPAWPGGPILSNLVVNADGSPLVRREGQQAAATTTAADGAAQGAELDGSLVIYVPPKGFHEYQPGTGKRIPKDSVLSWTVHYTMTGRPEKDRSRVGFWFQQGPTTVETITRRASSRDGFKDSFIAQSQEVPDAIVGAAVCSGPCLPVIPPYEDNYAATAITAFQDDVTIHMMWPHMHLRAKDAAYLVTYPDGREEVLLYVPHYNFNWQMYYELAQPVKLPAGSTLKVIAHYDNSVKNRENPAPDKEVYWSEQSWDEMFTGFYEMSIDKRERRLEPPGSP
jgi:hypothetical protein